MSVQETPRNVGFAYLQQPLFAQGITVEVNKVAVCPKSSFAPRLLGSPLPESTSVRRKGSTTLSTRLRKVRAGDMRRKPQCTCNFASLLTWHHCLDPNTVVMISRHATMA